jgi:hypothetical protein
MKSLGHGTVPNLNVLWPSILKGQYMQPGPDDPYNQQPPTPPGSYPPPPPGSYPPGGYGGPTPGPSNDRVTLWGVLGIVFAFCCWPLGIVFAVLGLLEARKVGKQPTLAYVAFGIIALAFVVNIILAATGTLGNLISNSNP